MTTQLLNGGSPTDCFPTSSPIVNYRMAPPNDYLEKMRAAEALAARDYAVHQMENATASLRSKECTITQLQAEKASLEAQLAGLSLGGVTSTERKGDGIQDTTQVVALVKENAELKERLRRLQASHRSEHLSAQLDSPQASFPPLTPVVPSVNSDACVESPEEIIRARYAILADLPVPKGMPTDTLVPIVIPPPCTLQDFIGTTAGPMRLQLANYRVFQESTTCWCPEREEHGYFITPLFKCNTNPRVSTAHRWIAVEIDRELDKPTECFFNKDGKWYYAGVYKTFKLRDIAPQEWNRLAPETTQTLIKDTLTHRKNTSPQNIYETGQLYAVGALKAACIGLQCIGFNEALYQGLLAQADVCAKTGRWRGATIGLGAGAAWNVNANSGAENIKTHEDIKSSEDNFASTGLENATGA